MDRLELETCTVDIVRRVVRGADGLVRLSPKEAALLDYLADRPGATVSREELLREVWGYREGVMSRTLDTTVRTLRAKIEADRTTPSHVLTDPGGGYRFEPSRPAPTPAPAAPPPPTASLAVQEPNRFVGRTADVAQIDALFSGAAGEEGCRLVTIIGAAGVGKTRLARRATRILAGRGLFPGGIRLADLIGCTTPDDAAHAVALALNPEAMPQIHAEAIGAQLTALGPALLVLDNIDSVVEPVSSLVSRWLDQAKELRVLVTSRERLRLRAEHVQALEPLALSDAFELLRDRAQAASLALDAEGEACLEELASRLEGLPLALELAAARLPALGPKGVVERLHLGFSFLGDESRDLPVRHTSLHRAIQVSWDLLPSWARDAWMQTSVFVGGFDLPAANAVIDITRYSNSPPVEQVLYLLAERCLIRRTSSADLRFIAFESLRSFARKRLDLAERGPGVQLRHASWYLRLGEQLTGLANAPSETVWYTLELRPQPRCELERANLLGAWQALSERGPAEHTARLAIVLCTGALSLPLATRVELVEQARGRLEAMPVVWRARVHLLLGALRLAAGDIPGAAPDAQRALMLAVESADTSVVAEALDLDGQIARLSGRLADAHDRYERALRLVHEHHDPVRRAILLTGMAAVLRARGRGTPEGALRGTPSGALRGTPEGALRGASEPDAATLAEDHYTRALALFRRAQATVGQGGQGQVLGHLGTLLTEAGRIDEGRVCVDDAVRMTGVLVHTPRHVEALLQHGAVASAEGDLNAADLSFRRALELGRALGAARQVMDAQLGLISILLLRANARGALEQLEASELQAVPHPLDRCRTMALRGIAECLAGRPTSALASLGEAEITATSLDDARTASTALAMSAWAHAALGRTEVARQLARDTRARTAAGTSEERVAALLDNFVTWMQTPPGEPRDDLRRMLTELAVDSDARRRGLDPADVAWSVARVLVARLLKVNG